MTFNASFSPGSLGDGAMTELAFTVGGAEYAGNPAPLSNVTVHLPAGVGGSRTGFATCEASTLRLTGPAGCPPGSVAGPQGDLTMKVAFGNERVPELGTVQAFFGSGRAINFYVTGTSPVSVEFIMTATYAVDSAPFSHALNVSVPPVETVPGAPLASITSLTLGLGASRRERGMEERALTIPAECVPGGFGWLASIGFTDGTTAQASYRSPCPTGHPSSPLLGQREVVAVKAGEVTVRTTGAGSFRPLAGAGTIPDGSEIDATHGRVAISAATAISGQSKSAEIYGGRLLVHQDAVLADTHLTLSLPLRGCAGARFQGRASATVATRARRRSGARRRRLWVSEGGGSWNTSGRYVSTSVEGTKWLTQDECARSIVKVASGEVTVRDLVSRRTQTVSAGEAYVARRERHR
jgi:hypothetical protein